MMLAGFKIAGYVIGYSTQALWYLAHGSPVRVGDAIGELSRGVTDAIAGIFRE